MLLAVIILSCFLGYQLYIRRHQYTGRSVTNKQQPIPEHEVAKRSGTVPEAEPLSPAALLSSEDMSHQERAFNLNFLQEMHNTQQFGEHKSHDLIIMIQIHNRPENLRYLLSSLQNARGIENTTIVLSRDYFSEEMDLIVRSIDFARYVEIFFPFAMQLHPNKFPGEDPNDCPRDLSKSDALAKGCLNAEHPDMYGHYREVNYVQIKHHWFWKLHMVFAGMRAFKHSQSPVLLLEEDYYVVNDIIHCIKKVLAMPEADRYPVISTGNYDKAQNYFYQGSELQVLPWVSSKNNMGMVLQPSFYQQFLQCTDQFCNFDDYNWDWSLQAVAPNCMAQPLQTISFSATRVYHIGACGTHVKSGSCNLEAVVEDALKNFRNAELFPASFRVVRTDSNRSPIVTPNGGWGDMRDRTLCKKYHQVCSSLLKF